VAVLPESLPGHRSDGSLGLAWAAGAKTKRFYSDFDHRILDFFDEHR
jgi:hypothetical protein